MNAYYYTICVYYIIMPNTINTSIIQHYIPTAAKLIKLQLYNS